MGVPLKGMEIHVLPPGCWNVFIDIADVFAILDLASIITDLSPKYRVLSTISVGARIAQNGTKRVPVRFDSTASPVRLLWIIAARGTSSGFVGLTPCWCFWLAGMTLAERVISSIFRGSRSGTRTISRLPSAARLASK